MPLFKYVALDTAGKQSAGKVDAVTIAEAKSQISDLGLILLEVVAVENSSWQLGLSKYTQVKLTPRELMVTIRQFAAMLQAGLSVEDALDGLVEQELSSRVTSTYRKIRLMILEGESLANSFAAFPTSFSQAFVASVAAAEKSGTLDSILNELANDLESSNEFSRKIKLSLVYPMCLVVISVFIVYGLLVFVVPDIVEVFTKNNQELPRATEILIAISDNARSGSLGMALTIAGLIILQKLISASERLLFRQHKLYLKLPGLGRVLTGFETSRYGKVLSMMSKSGVSLVEAMNVSSRGVSNLALRQKVTEACKSVEEGASLAQSLQATGVFPSIMIHMIKGGEASGQLDEMLEKAAEQQQQELSAAISVLVSLFEPLVLVLMGGVVLFIVLATMLPILNINQLVG